MLKGLFSPRAVDVPREMEHARACHAEGRLQEAEKACLKVVGAEPRHVEALTLLGSICLAQGKAADAARRFGEALAIDPAHIAARMNEAAAFEGLGRQSDALADYDRVVAAVPEHVEVLTRRAHVLRALQRPDEAKEGFERALVRKPDDFAALSGLGQLLNEQGRLVESIAGDGGNLVAVADPDQSIYSWRGADPGVVDRFAAAPGARVFPLQTNYRSSATTNYCDRRVRSVQRARGQAVAPAG